MGMKFSLEDSSTPNFTPIGATCHICGAKKPQNSTLTEYMKYWCHCCMVMAVVHEFLHIYNMFERMPKNSTRTPQ